MLDSLFEALFSYRPVVFQQGEFRFDVTTASLVATLIVAVVVGLAVLTYRRVRVNEGRLRDRVILTSLRVAALALVLFCLFRPTLVVRAAVDQQNVVAVLLDDSRSMQIPDWGGKPRGAFVKEQFGLPDSPLLKALSDRFLVRVFRFSSTATRMGVGRRDELQRTADQARRGARRRARRAGRAAGGRGRPGHRRRRHERRLARSGAAGDESAEAAGLYRGRRQRAAAAGRPDRSGHARRARS